MAMSPERAPEAKTDWLTVSRNMTLTDPLTSNTPRLSVNTKLTLYKELIMSIMTYDCPAWEFAADSHLLKLLRPRNKVLHTTANLPRRTPTHDLHVAFKVPCLYDFVTKLFTGSSHTK
jgi:hypothetical protein